VNAPTNTRRNVTKNALMIKKMNATLIAILNPNRTVVALKNIRRNVINSVMAKRTIKNVRVIVNLRY
jgi:hypothetical protein